MDGRSFSVETFHVIAQVDWRSIGGFAGLELPTGSRDEYQFLSSGRELIQAVNSLLIFDHLSR